MQKESVAPSHEDVGRGIASNGKSDENPNILDGAERQPLRFIRSEWIGREPVKLDFFPFPKCGPDYFTQLDSCESESKSRELTEEDCNAFVPKRGGVKVSGNNWMGFWYAGEFVLLGTQIYDDNGIERKAFIYEFWLEGDVLDPHMYLATWTDRPEVIAEKIKSYQNNSN